MIERVIVVALGLCTYFNPGVMERVADYRGLARQPGDVGMVAVLDCEQIGRRIWLEHDGTIEGPFLVADCAEAKHLANLHARGLVAEVDWQTAQRWQMAGPVACAVVEVLTVERQGGTQEGWE